MSVLYCMKHRWKQWLSGQFWLSLCCAAILLLLPLGMNLSRVHQEQTAAVLSPNVLRFHVLSNSDAPEDQQLKLEVRTLLLDSIYRGLENFDMEAGSSPETVLSKEILRNYVLKHKKELESAAEQYMKTQGFPYSARIQLERCYFPTRRYDGLTFPSGVYDAVRVLLGQGAGRNWWCVLYPPLCFSGALSIDELPDSSGQQLKHMVPAEDYTWMTSSRTVTFGDSPDDAAVTIRVRLKITDLLKRAR